MSSYFKKLFVIIFLITASTQAIAGGIGVYMNYSGGMTKFDKVLKPYSGLREINGKFFTDSVGGGAIVELFSVEKQSLVFRYRFRAGGEAMFARKNVLDKMLRISFTNTFYFRIAQYRFFELLFGPQIGGLYRYGKKAVTYPSLNIISGVLYSSINKESVLVKTGGVNVGLSLSFDFNVTDYLLVFMQVNGDQYFYFSKLKGDGVMYYLNPPPPPMPPAMTSGIILKKLQTDFGTEGSVCIGIMKKF